MLFSDATGAHRKFLGTRKFGSLDGVRGLCILGILWHHSGLELPGVFFHRAFLAVDMFFVLSGFLIVTLLLRERDRTGDISLRKFYARRTLRIFPIYYLLLFVLLILYAVLKPGTKTAGDYFASLPYLLTYTSNWVPVQASNLTITWSLATEEQFYLGWPLIEKLLRPPGVALVLVLVLIVNQLMNFGVLDFLFTALYGSEVNLNLQILDVTYTPIALGVLLAHVLHAPQGFRFFFPLVGRRGSCVVFGGLLASLVAIWPGDISGAGRLLMQLSMMLLLGSLVIREDHTARAALAFPPIAALGVISYGVYLYHMWAMHPVALGFMKLGWDRQSYAYLFVSVLASTIVAGLSYRFIEQPLLKLKTRFSTDRACEVGQRPPRDRSALDVGEAATIA
jgi:peptidoglycan/LPS O-acetylase OafA/YrhL